jgi:hypothetical protein
MGNIFWKAFLGAFWREEENEQDLPVSKTNRIQSAYKELMARSRTKYRSAFDRTIGQRNSKIYPSLLNLLNNLNTKTSKQKSKQKSPIMDNFYGGARKTRKNKNKL